MRHRPGLVALLLSLALPAVAAAQQPIADQPVRRASTQYIVSPGDLLHIRVWPDSSLGGSYMVEESGLVYLPVIGPYRAGGRSVNEVRSDLRKQYLEALKSPLVVVTPLFKVSVLGEVGRPGIVEAEPGQTVLDAVSLAGGFREDAKTADVRLVRDGQVIHVNAHEAFDQGGTAADIPLKSGDRVVVPHAKSLSAITVLYGIQSLLLLATVYHQFR